MSMAKFGMLHVPYRGGGPALQALVAGEVNIGFVDSVIALPMAEGGQDPHARRQHHRTAAARPGGPDHRRSGVAGFQSSTDVALLAPAGTPAAIIRELTRRS